jgi:hypothetical protein
MRHTKKTLHSDTSMDLRRGPRFELRGSVTFEGEGHVGSGKIFNVSSWGCGVESMTNVIPGMYVGVSLSLPNQPTPVEIELAAVRWSARRRFGVEFLSISQPSRKRLEQFLDRREESSQLESLSFGPR